jgi:alcohol dehydrogenase, propanol-preferring
MKAMVINKLGPIVENSRPLEAVELPAPEPAADEILIKVSACGVCHTELDEIEGRTPPPRLPVVPGHQVVGRVVKTGTGAGLHKIGGRVGVAWIFWACGHCPACRHGNENLCSHFQATGRDSNGGYAEFMTVKEEFAFPLPEVFTDAQAAPLLCAGAIGYRSLALTALRDGETLGLCGFGASAHLVLMLARYRYPGSRVYVFARSPQERQFALALGAEWAGDHAAAPPEELRAIIDTTPAWQPIVEALRNLQPGGRLVINAIRKEETDKRALLALDYPSHLWLEKEIKSVANVTRRDVREFLDLAARIPIIPKIQQYPLEEANRALLELKNRQIRGAKVLMAG